MSRADRDKIERGLAMWAEHLGIDSWTDTIMNFVSAELAGKKSSSKSRQAAAVLLLSMFDDAKRGRPWNDYRMALDIRKWSGEFNPYADPVTFKKAYGIAMEYIAYHLTEREALDRLTYLTGESIEEGTARGFIRKYKPEIRAKLKNASHLNGSPIKKIR